MKAPSQPQLEGHGFPCRIRIHLYGALLHHLGHVNAIDEVGLKGGIVDDGLAKVRFERDEVAPYLPEAHEATPSSLAQKLTSSSLSKNSKV